MEIKFIELLSKTGGKQNALFEVGAQKEVIIGVAYSLLSSLGLPHNRSTCIDFLKEFGPLKIQWMFAEENVQDYIFVSDHFKKGDDQAMTQEEIRSYLQNKIIETENKSRTIGFKNN